MRADILTAAIRVLRREGASRFTTPRVAEAAGVSVGSLYQYFPNKQSLVFAIHSASVERAWVRFERILGSQRTSPHTKIERLARMFFLAESKDVAELGSALQDAEPFFADQPEAQAMGRAVLDRLITFVRTVSPDVSEAEASYRAQFVITVLESVGKSVARSRPTTRIAARWARDCAALVSARLDLVP